MVEEEVCLNTFDSVIYQPLSSMSSKNITSFRVPEPISLENLLEKINLPFGELMKCNKLNLTSVSDGSTTHTQVLMVPHEAGSNTMYIVVIAGVVFLVFVGMMYKEKVRESDRKERESIRRMSELKDNSDRKERVIKELNDRKERELKDVNDRKERELKDVNDRKLKELIIDMARNNKVSGTECAQILQAAFNVKVDDIVVVNDGSQPSSVGCVSVKSSP